MTEAQPLVPAKPTDAELHRETSQWRSEAALWLDELAAWHKEHEKAVADLARIEMVLHQFAGSEPKDREELAAYGQQLCSHEHALARFIQGSEDVSRDDIRNQHRWLAYLREEHRARHEVTKRTLLAAEAEIDAVRKATAT